MKRNEPLGRKARIATLFTVVVVDLVSVLSLVPSESFASLIYSKASIPSVNKSSYLSDSYTDIPLVSEFISIDSDDVDKDDDLPANRSTSESITQAMPCRVISKVLGSSLKVQGCPSATSTNKATPPRRATTVQRTSVQNNCSSSVVQSSSQSSRITGNGRTVSQSSSTVRCR